VGLFFFEFVLTPIYFIRNVFIFALILLFMTLAIIIFIIGIIIAAIWMIFGFKRMKHKLLALFLIALVLFSFFSFNSAFKGKDVTVNSISDLGKAVKIYFLWLGNIASNLKTISGQAVKLDWQGNNTS
jgi:hypothetical protein